jgi:hypothetical protein
MPTEYFNRLDVLCHKNIYIGIIKYHYSRNKNYNNTQKTNTINIIKLYHSMRICNAIKYEFITLGIFNNNFSFIDKYNTLEKLPSASALAIKLLDNSIDTIYINITEIVNNCKTENVYPNVTDYSAKYLIICGKSIVYKNIQTYEELLFCLFQLIINKQQQMINKLM